MDKTPDPKSLPQPSGTPKREWHLDRRPLKLSLELVLAAVLTLAVAGGLVVAGGSGRILEVALLLVAAGAAVYTGWPVSALIALGAAAAYLVLEAVFGRIAAAHAPTELVLTLAIAGSVAACGFARSGYASKGVRKPALKRRRRKPKPVVEPQQVEPLVDTPAGPKRLTAGTLEYEVERARECGRPLSVLSVRPDDLDALAAPSHVQLGQLLDLLDAEIESTVRAIDVVGPQGPTQFQVILPETGFEGARTVAERIRLRVDSTLPELALGLSEGVTFSIGVATYPTDGVDEVELDAAAQRALARAAELGGNRTVLHSVPAGAPPGWGLSAAAGTRPLQPQH